MRRRHEAEVESSVKKNYEDEAVIFVNAIKEISEKPDNLENLESYLSYHFATWLERFASDPADIAGELKNFAEMNI